MQKSFIAIALALTLTCAFAAYSPITTGYSKAPVSAAADNDTSYTNAGSISLISATIGELDLLGTNTTAQTFTSSTWNAVYRKLDGKTLAASTNSSVALSGGLTGAVAALYINGYAVSFSYENDTNGIPQISVYQTPLNGNAALSKIFVSSNNKTWWSPAIVGAAIISKTVYVFYTAANTSNVTSQVNVTNFAVGSTTKGSGEFNLTTTYTNSLISTLSVVWGEALGSNQLFANWIDGGVLKDATIDVSKGTATVNVVGGWNNSLACTTFSTDKKWFGDLCFYTNTEPNVLTTTYFVRSNTTSLIQLVTNGTNTTSWTAVYPYGPYIAITYADTVYSTGRLTYSYDIWNLDSFTPYRNKTAFVTYDSSNSTVTTFRVTSGGLFTLLANIKANVSGVVYNNSGIQVGLVLGSSYLTSVLGFILTIVAGLLLF